MTGGAAKGNWADLKTRVVSGVVLAALGIGLLISTGIVLRIGLSVLVGLMIWELARLTGHLDQHARNERHARLTGALAGLAFAGATLLPDAQIGGVLYSMRWAYALPLLPLVLGWRGSVARNRWPFALFFIGILGAATGIAFAREGIGLEAVIWIAGVVVISDIMGYFAGRAFGGPKFWPAISPKKTWSGTVAGWIGALVFTIILQMIVGRLDLVQILLAPVIALAGQMGDIAESWLKRRVGVKDSSDLIPGHGGVMDRFDAMAGAFLAMMLISLAIAGYLLIFDFPVSGG